MKLSNTLKDYERLLRMIEASEEILDFIESVAQKSFLADRPLQLATQKQLENMRRGRVR